MTISELLVCSEASFALFVIPRLWILSTDHLLVLC